MPRLGSLKGGNKSSRKSSLSLDEPIDEKVSVFQLNKEFKDKLKDNLNKFSSHEKQAEKLEAEDSIKTSNRHHKDIDIDDSLSTFYSDSGKIDIVKTSNRHRKDIVKTSGKNSEKINAGINLDLENVTENLVQKKKKSFLPDKVSYISEVSGNQKMIFDFLFSLCESIGMRTTPPLTLDYILSETDITSKFLIKNNIERLVAKGVLLREKGKRGRGGFIRLSIPEDFYMQKMNAQDTINKPFRNQFDMGHLEVKNVVLDSRVGAIDNRMSANENPNTSELPKEWLDIDFSELNGFSIHHLKQLYERNVSNPQEIQNSINAFVFDLNENDKAASIKLKDPIPFFLGILNRQGVYVAPGNYESPKDKAMREYLAIENEKQKKRQKIEQELMAVSFENWHEGLTIKAKCQFLNMEQTEFTSETMMKPMLKNHYQENIWLDVKRNIIG
jgi:hypothetical protein